MAHFIISQPEAYQKKFERFRKAGVEQIHVLSDFDNTLTKAYYNGEKIPSLIAELRRNDYLGKEYTKEAYALFDYYHPIERDPTISTEKKTDAMMKWWRAHDQLLIDYKVTQDILQKAAVQTHHLFRESMIDCVDFMHAQGIPLIIISAGLGDMINALLKSVATPTEHVYVIANFFKFNDRGIAVDSVPPTIHTMNKSEVIVKEFPFYSEIEQRPYVIAMGDHHGDLGMIDGFDYEELITIGFFNDLDQKNLQQYTDAFDVVILNDGSMEFVYELLQKCIE